MIQKVPDGIDSKFRMTLLIARRAEQLMRGSRPKIEAETPVKPTRLAAQELDQHLFRWDLGPEGGILPDEGEEDQEAAPVTEGDE